MLGRRKDDQRALMVLKIDANGNSVPVGDMSLGELLNESSPTTMKGGVPRAATTAYSIEKRFN
jgi:hypothetical protein